MLLRIEIPCFWIFFFFRYLRTGEKTGGGVYIYMIFLQSDSSHKPKCKNTDQCNYSHTGRFLASMVKSQGSSNFATLRPTVSIPQYLASPKFCIYLYINYDIIASSFLLIAYFNLFLLLSYLNYSSYHRMIDHTLAINSCLPHCPLYL